MVFAGVFPTDNAEYPELRDALTKLTLNDASVTWEPESSVALGFGFRLRLPRPAAHGDHPGAARARVRPRHHHDRAQREVQVYLNRTAPMIVIDNPAKMPDVGQVRGDRRADDPGHRIQLPEEHLGPIIKLCQDRRGTQL
jgi:GTP-binding protein LepA